jgi:hypothetical protein
MSVIGTYSVNNTPETLSSEYSTLDELLVQLPDNTSNLIVAQDIRDSVLTLWNRIDSVSVVASQSATFSVFYTNPNSVPVTIGGINAGMSFSGTFSVQQMFDMLLYPYITPGASISVDKSLKEFGENPTVILSWNVTRNTGTVSSIIVNGAPVVPTGDSQSGTSSASAIANTLTTFTMSVSDGTSTINGTTSVSWLNKRYWGIFPTLSPLTSPQIYGLSGAGIGTGNELASNFSRSYNGINGGGQYLTFAWPTSFGTPTFTINGLPNTAFTKVNSSFAFTNVWGYVENYDVWMSNTPQNAPITLFQIS